VDLMKTYGKYRPVTRATTRRVPKRITDTLRTLFAVRAHIDDLLDMVVHTEVSDKNNDSSLASSDSSESRCLAIFASELNL
jgi:hypothetical protein